MSVTYILRKRGNALFSITILIIISLSVPLSTLLRIILTKKYEPFLYASFSRISISFVLLLEGRRHVFESVSVENPYLIGVVAGVQQKPFHSFLSLFLHRSFLSSLLDSSLFSVHILLLLHHYKSDLAHLSYLYTVQSLDSTNLKDEQQKEIKNEQVTKFAHF